MASSTPSTPPLPTPAPAAAAPQPAVMSIPFNPSHSLSRMYENQYPDVDDLVIVNVRQIAEMGAYVRLLEYNDIEGMILLSELSRRRIRSVAKLLRVGRNEVVVVLRVDKEKGYIDLSKRRVGQEDIARAEEKYAKSKAVHSIMRHVAERKRINLTEFYEQVGWPLYKKFGHAFNAFKLAITEPTKVFEGIKMEENVYNELITIIKRRLTPQAIKIRADVEVQCFGYDGIDAIKASLLAAEALRTEEVDVKIKLVAPPLYIIHTTTLEKAIGIETVENAIIALEDTMRRYAGGRVVVKMKPRAVSASDDQELAALMLKVEMENQEVSADDTDDSEEGESAEEDADAE